MGLISLRFAAFVLTTMVVYFLFPKKYRWTVLLAASYAYYLIICNKYILYMMITTVTTWAGALRIDALYREQKAQVKAHKAEWSREERKQYKEMMLTRCRRMMILVLVVNFGILGVLKYSAFAAEIAEQIVNLFGAGVVLPKPGFLLPLGISFYTFQSMGYVIDVYQEKVEAEKNLARLALFVSFFPQIVQGPIGLYDELAHQLYEPHDFDSERLRNGGALILWGIFKKIVIADRAVKIIDLVTADSSQFSGTFILFAALLYALQLYADFSGGIDVVRGIAEIFGITMAENFRRPYFAKSLTEYWHRWHITLGNWVREYVFYPLSISKTFLGMGKSMSKKFGKHIGKVFPTSLASLITFLIIGIWHGANGKYVAFGLWNGLVIMLVEILRPVTDRVEEKLHVKKESRGFGIICMVWTFILVLIGYYFDIARNFGDAMSMLVRSVTDLHISDIHNISVLSPSGLDRWDMIVIAVAGLFLFAVSLIQEKSERTIREMLWEKPLILRWCFLWLAIVVILIFGYYGPDMDPAAFVYMQF